MSGIRAFALSLSETKPVLTTQSASLFHHYNPYKCAKRDSPPENGYGGADCSRFSEYPQHISRRARDWLGGASCRDCNEFPELAESMIWPTPLVGTYPHDWSVRPDQRDPIDRLAGTLD